MNDEIKLTPTQAHDFVMQKHYLPLKCPKCKTDLSEEPVLAAPSNYIEVDGLEGKWDVFQRCPKCGAIQRYWKKTVFVKLPRFWE